MSLIFSESTSSTEVSVPDQIFQSKDAEGSSISLLSDTRMEKLKKFLPRPKPPVSIPLRQILKTKKLVTRRDFTAGPTLPIELEKGKPFQYPNDLEFFGYQVMTRAWREDKKIKELQKKLTDKKSVSGKLNEDLFERLRVHDPPKDLAVFIQDINPEYMKTVEGRPFGDISTSVRDYIKTVRDVLKTKIVLGYREDDIYLIDANIKTEQRMIELINRNYQKYVNIFEDFLSRDHASAVNLLKRSKQVASELYIVQVEYKRISKLLNGITISLYRSEMKWRYCKLQQQFLFKCSPLHWRMEHKESITPTDDDKIQERPRGESFFADLVNELDSMADLNLADILAEVEAECKTHDEQKLYFSDPRQLLELFDYMQAQNLNNLVHKEELAQPLAIIQENMETAENNFNKIIEQYRFNVNRLEDEIQWEENRAKELEQMAHDLIFSDFKELVSSEEVLNLYCCVEDLYESIIAPNTNFNAQQMIVAIVQHYRDELFFLDQAPSEEVTRLETSTVIEYQKLLDFAEKATKQCSDLDNITKAIKRGYLPPYQKPRYKPLMFRYPPAHETKPPPTPPKELSEFELDYLDHFTEFCRHCDDPRDFGIDINLIKEQKRKSKSITEPKTITIGGKR